MDKQAINKAKAKQIADVISTSEGRRKLWIKMWFPMAFPRFGETEEQMLDRLEAQLEREAESWQR